MAFRPASQLGVGLFENTVPYIRGYKTQTGKNMVGFTHMFQLLRGASSSDLKGNLAGNRPRLNRQQSSLFRAVR